MSRATVHKHNTTEKHISKHSFETFGSIFEQLHLQQFIIKWLTQIMDGYSTNQQILPQPSLLS